MSDEKFFTLCVAIVICVALICITIETAIKAL